MASEYLKWKYRDVQPDEPVEYTPQQKRKNWWHYHKWHVLIGAVLLLIVLDVGRSALHIGETLPDMQMAYVGSAPLPDETITALEAALSERIADANGDGTPYVQINQYILAPGEGDNASYTAASAARLMGDMESCDSVLFLLEDPESFQKNYQILSRLDGSLPTGYEASFEDCYLRWSDCPMLTALDLGEYSAVLLDEKVSGDSQELLSSLYIARRGFWSDKTVKYPEACLDLWNTLTEGAAS